PQEAANLAATNPVPSNPHTLAAFVQAWQTRTVQGANMQWPSEWPLLELYFKLMSWLPMLRDDPEGLCSSKRGAVRSIRTSVCGGRAGVTPADFGNMLSWTRAPTTRPAPRLPNSGSDAIARLVAPFGSTQSSRIISSSRGAEPLRPADRFAYCTTSP